MAQQSDDRYFGRPFLWQISPQCGRDIAVGIHFRIFEAEPSQFGAKAAIVSADKSIGKATAILHIIGEQFMVSLEFDFDVKDLYSVCTRA